MTRATVSGSFHRHMAYIADAVGSLKAIGVEVLSPSDPRVVDADGEFLFVASDKLRSRRLVEDRHLEAIRASDFLWVVCPDGYTGASTSGEILAATVLGKPVFSTHAALDVTIGDYVRRVASMTDAVSQAAQAYADLAHRTDSVLLNPDILLDTAYDLDDLRLHLLRRRGNGKADAERAFQKIRRDTMAKLGIFSSN